MQMKRSIIIKLNFQPVWQERSSFFCDVTRRKLLVIYRSPDSSVNYYHSTLCNIKEEQRSRIHIGANLK